VDSLKDRFLFLHLEFHQEARYFNEDRCEREPEEKLASENDVLTEGAKAVQEVARTGGKAIDTVRSAGGFLDRIFGRPLEDTLAFVWTDRIAAKRIEAAIYDRERLVELAHKFEDRLKKKGILEAKAIPPKIALPLLEYATVEHEDDLHTLWANLLASGLDAGEAPIQRKYVTTLGEMTTADALVLSAMFEEDRNPRSKAETMDSSLTYGPGIDGTISYDATAVITLNRLGLIEPAYIKFRTFLPGGYDDRFGEYGPTQDEVRFPGDLSRVIITEFGYAFGRAVGLDEQKG
jgi:hypothetical protein